MMWEWLFLIVEYSRLCMKIISVKILFVRISRRNKFWKIMKLRSVQCSVIPFLWHLFPLFWSNILSLFYFLFEKIFKSNSSAVIFFEKKMIIEVIYRWFWLEFLSSVGIFKGRNFLESAITSFRVKFCLILPDIFSFISTLWVIRKYEKSLLRA